MDEVNPSGIRAACNGMHFESLHNHKIARQVALKILPSKYLRSFTAGLSSSSEPVPIAGILVSSMMCQPYKALKNLFGNKASVEFCPQCVSGSLVKVHAKLDCKWQAAGGLMPSQTYAQCSADPNVGMTRHGG